jgi:hypothetical protein
MSVVRGDEERYREGERLRETEDWQREKNIYFFYLHKNQDSKTMSTDKYVDSYKWRGKKKGIHEYDEIHTWRIHNSSAGRLANLLPGITNPEEMLQLVAILDTNTFEVFIWYILPRLVVKVLCLLISFLLPVDKGIVLPSFWGGPFIVSMDGSRLNEKLTIFFQRLLKFCILVISFRHG